jgi:hypothetical protein
LLGVHSRYGLHTRTVTVFRDSFTEGFNRFVTSTVAPVASGWSSCRVGLSPTGKRRLVTAHPESRRSRAAHKGRKLPAGGARIQHGQNQLQVRGVFGLHVAGALRFEQFGEALVPEALYHATPV